MHTISKKGTYNYLKNFIFCEVPNSTSLYNGVCWDKDCKKWQAQLRHKRKNYYGGLFDNEEQAAMKINLLCDKIEIKRRNPTIEIKPDIMQQSVIHSLSIGK